MGDPHRQPLKPAANVSVDVDGLNCYRAIHGLAPGPSAAPDPLWTLGVERAQRLFADVGLSATFFLVGQDLAVSAHRNLAKELFAAGHELANHSQTHPYDLRRQPASEIAYQLGACHNAIEALTGTAPVGFRTPGYNVSAEIIAAARRLGYHYDASICPCSTYWTAKALVMGWRRLRKEPSRSDRTDLRTLSAPREPYHPAPLKVWQPAKGESSFWEIPISVAFRSTLPMTGTSLHLLDTIGWEHLWPLLNKEFPRFFNLEFHAIDFIDRTDLEDQPDRAALVRRQPDLKISWTVKKARYRRVLSLICRDRRVTTLRKLFRVT